MLVESHRFKIRWFQFQSLDTNDIGVAILLNANNVVLLFRPRVGLQRLLNKLNEFALLRALKSIYLRIKS